MAVFTSKYSLIEQAKRLDPDGKLATIVEILNKSIGSILEEAPWIASNDVWVNKTVRRGTLPTSGRRKLNAGVATGVSLTTEIMDVIQMRGIYAEYDKAWIDSFPQPAVVRMQEAAAFIEGLSQDLARDFLYCNALVDPDGMHGLAARMDALNGDTVLGGSGTGNDVTSVYVVTWGPTEAHFIYPKNMANLGVTHQDLGEVTLTDGSGNKYQGYRDYFEVKCGFVVRNPRCIGRYANIESAGTTNIFNEDVLIALLNNMKTGATTRIYCNQTIHTQAEIALKNRANVNWTVEGGLGGVPFLKFRGIPVRMVDKAILLNTESAIS